MQDNIWCVCLIPDMAEVPTKCVSKKVELQVKANIVFIDFEGRSDGESIRKILSQIKPRQMVSTLGTTCVRLT